MFKLISLGNKLESKLNYRLITKVYFHNMVGEAMRWVVVIEKLTIRQNPVTVRVS